MYNPNQYGGQYGGAPAYGQSPYGSAYGAPASSSHHQPPDDKLAKVKDPLLNAVKWVKARSPQEKLILGCAAGVVVSRALGAARRGWNSLG
jgi:hypothetical protein